MKQQKPQKLTKLKSQLSTYVKALEKKSTFIANLFKITYFTIRIFKMLL